MVNFSFFEFRAWDFEFSSDNYYNLIINRCIFNCISLLWRIYEYYKPYRANGWNSHYHIVPSSGDTNLQDTVYQRYISFDVSFIHDGGITMAHLWRLAGAMANHYTKHNNSDSCIDNYLFQNCIQVSDIRSGASKV